MLASLLAIAFLTMQDPVANPADQKPKQDKEKEYVQSYEIVGERVSDLQEEDRIGPYGQPRWTATRRFPTTRIYVVPEGKMEFEWWMRTTFPKDDGPAEVRYLWELEMGLPHRFQLDFYLGMDAEGSQGDFDFTRQQVEVRWAMADWGKIWGNPTLYVEYINKVDESDAAEYKLLIGDELASGWHWGLNGVFETELHDSLTHEWQLTGGISYTVTDMKLSVGAEIQAIWEDTVHTRGHFDETIFLGPSIQWHPRGPATINVSVLAGIGPESPDMRTFVNVGWEF